MTHEERLYALQLITEERYGVDMRRAGEASQATRNASRRQMGLPPIGEA